MKENQNLNLSLSVVVIKGGKKKVLSLNWLKLGPTPMDEVLKNMPPHNFFHNLQGFIGSHTGQPPTLFLLSIIITTCHKVV